MHTPNTPDVLTQPALTAAQRSPARGWRHCRRLATRQDGVAMVMALLAIVAVASLGSFGAYTAQTELKIARNDLLAKQALATAEAGINHAIALIKGESTDGIGDELSASGTGGAGGGIINLATTTTTLEDNKQYRYRSFGGGAYYVRVEDNFDEIANANDPNVDTDNKVKIISRGRVGGAERIIETAIGTSSLFNMAIFGDLGVTLDSNACTDSYDSAAGSYTWSPPQQCNGGSNADVGTNATTAGPPAAISLDSNVEVKGDAFVGPGGNPSTAISLGSNATVSGSQSAASSPKNLPPVTAPSLSSQAAINNSDNCQHQANAPVPHAATANVTISASGQYPSIRLDSNACLIIDTTAGSITIVTGSFELDSNSHIDIRGTNKVTLYVTGNPLNMDSNSKIINQVGPTQLAILATSAVTNVTLNSNTGFYGTIYAPNSAITIDSNGQLYGAVIGRTIALDSNAAVHYDEAVGKQPDSCCEVAYWNEVRN